MSGFAGMVLAAGLGTRMAPLTDDTPKPLIRVDEQPLIDYALASLEAVEAHPVVANVHYLADQIYAHLEGTGVLISDETEELLETGGGVTKALPLLGDRPFFVVNSDSILRDGDVPALARLAAAFDPDRMDALLLLADKATAVGFDGPGDFFLGGEIPIRRGKRAEAPFVFTGTQILTPSLFDGEAVRPFSLNRIYDKAAERGRLFAIVHDGGWYHVGTPAARDETTRIFRGLGG